MQNIKSYLFALEEFGGKDFKQRLDQMEFVIKDLVAPLSCMDDRIKQAYLLSYSMGIEVLIKTIFSFDDVKTFAKETSKINQVYDAYLSSINIYKEKKSLIFEFGYKNLTGKQNVYKPYDWTTSFKVPEQLVTESNIRRTINALMMAHTERPYFLEGEINVVEKEIDPSIPRSDQRSTRTNITKIKNSLTEFFNDNSTNRSVTFNRRSIYFNEINKNSISYIFKGVIN
jgi:exonuclease III